MNQFIPYEKLSKKEKRKQNAAKRTVWDISPVTRRPENPKAYNRQKTHREFCDDSLGAFSALSCLRLRKHWHYSSVITFFTAVS